MNHLTCALLLAAPLLAQSPLRLTRHAGLPSILEGGALAVADLDGDGDLDVFFGNDNSPNQLLLNDGRGRFVDATLGRFVNVSSNASHSVDLADIDGDGDFDILVGNDDFLSNRVYVNNGAGFFTDVTATALPPNAEFTQNQVVADFDGDGDADWFTVDSPGCHLYANNGAGVFTDISATHLHNIPPAIGQRYVMAASADVDSDGDLDILVPNLGMPTLIVNQGGGHFWPATTPLPNLAISSWATYHKFVDIDGDGDQDILLDQARFVLQNQGNGTFLDVTATAFPSAHAQTLASFDVDGDGDVDLVTTTVLWQNDGTGHFIAQAIPTTTFPFPSLTAFYAADFDGDGDLDAPPRMNFTRQVDAPAAPSRGGTYTVAFHTRPGVTSTVVAFASLAEVVVPAGALGTLRLDQAMMATIAIQNVAASPLQVSLPIPNVVAFLGVQLHYQAFVVDPVTGPHLTNAIREFVQ